MAIKTPLMDHQKLIVSFCKDKQYAGIFADYGTGKTLSALALIQVNKWKKVLVVSTKLAIETTWCDEIRKHTDFRFCILRGTSKSKLKLLNYALGKVEDWNRYGDYGDVVKPMIFLINYEGIRPIFYELAHSGFDAIIADESTKIKSIQTKRTVILVELGKYVENRFVLTGFPVTEHLAELYSQVKFLDQGKTFGNSYWKFLNKYFVRMGMKIVVRKKSIREILDAIKPFCIRITNEMLKLPPKIYKQINVELTTTQRNVLSSLNDSFKVEFGKVKIDTQYLFTLISKSLQVCDGFIQQNENNENTIELIETNKDEALVEILDEINVFKNKVVIWCAFLFSIRKLKKILDNVYKNSGIEILTLTGESEDVNDLVNVFRKSSKHNILIATQKKAAESVTLTEARYAIYYSNLWSYDLRANSEARICRKGSERHKSIIYIDLATKGTIEEKVLYCLKKKKDLIGELKNMFLERMV